MNYFNLTFHSEEEIKAEIKYWISRKDSKHYKGLYYILDKENDIEMSFKSIFFEIICFNNPYQPNPKYCYKINGVSKQKKEIINILKKQIYIKNKKIDGIDKMKEILNNFKINYSFFLSGENVIFNIKDLENRLNTIKKIKEF
jgi:hypothetical protein